MPASKEVLEQAELICETVVGLRGRKVIPDVAVAELEDISVSSVRRVTAKNMDQFVKGDVLFLTEEEKRKLGITARGKAYAYTEDGLYMLILHLPGERAEKHRIAMVGAYAAGEMGMDDETISAMMEPIHGIMLGFHLDQLV